MIDVTEWLDNWVDDNINSPQFHEAKSAMAGEARECEAAALADGISRDELLAAVGGDLEQYLLDAQNSFTTSEVARKVESDKY